MMKLLRVIFVASFFVLLALAAQAQPANDNFTNAWLLAGTSVTTNGNSGQNGVVANATRQDGEPQITGRNGGRSVWFRWTAPFSGQTRIDTSGSAFNTLLGVYTGTAVNALTLVAENDNGTGLDGQDSLVEFAATAGTTYRIAIDGRNNLAEARPRTLFHVGPGAGASHLAHQRQHLRGRRPHPGGGTASVPGRRWRVWVYRAILVGFTLFGSVTNPPYSLTTSNSPLGTNLFASVAIDSADQPWVSPFVSVLVLNPGVTIVAPSDGAALLTTNPITVTAISLVPSGAMTNVEFFADGQRFGADSTIPFSVVWNTVSGGLHRLTAVGKANSGIIYTSAPVLIAVAQTFVRSNSVWKYLDNGSDQGTAWFAPDFDDSPGRRCALGYGDPTAGSR
jgi:hypothetical protein